MATLVDLHAPNKQLQSKHWMVGHRHAGMASDFKRSLLSTVQ